MSMTENNVRYVHKYNDGYYKVVKHEFPVGMGMYDFVEHLGYEDQIMDENTAIPYDIHRSKEIAESTGSYTYLITLNVFDDHYYCIECDSFPNLLKLLKEVECITNINEAYERDMK